MFWGAIDEWFALEDSCHGGGGEGEGKGQSREAAERMLMRALGCFTVVTYLLPRMMRR